MGGYVLRKRETLAPQAKALMKQRNIRRSVALVSDDTRLQNIPGGAVVSGANNFRMLESTYSYRDGGEADATQPAEILNTARENARVNSQVDKGHEFWSEKRWITLSHEKVTLRGTNGSVAVGPLYPNGVGLASSIAHNVPLIETNYYGNKAIASAAPTAPNANFSVTAAELVRERLTPPGMAGLADWLKSRSSLGRSLGKEWLNYQFGLSPAMSDAAKLFKSMQNMNKTILQLLRDDGRQVRRRYYFPPSLTTTASSGSGMGVHMLQTGSDIDGGAWGPLYKVGSQRVSNYRIVEKVYQRYWFSGAFVYKIPVDDGTLIGHFRRYEFFLNKLTGVRITPEVLWELVPWSWLVDWAVDVQSFLRANSLLQNDGLVINYGYLMRTYKYTKTVTLDGLQFNNPQGYSNGTPISATQHVKRIERVRSTPFGFGLNPSSFTERQWAILAAVGISRFG